MFWLAIVAAYVVFVIYYPRYRLKYWAKQNGFTVVSLERRYLDTGPFPRKLRFLSPVLEEICRVAVTDSAGTPKEGWLRLGGFVGDCEVYWDDEAEGTRDEARSHPSRPVNGQSRAS